jgi:dienelactone hydrolase
MAMYTEQYDSGTESVPADVYLPDGVQEPVPGVLVIHGSAGLAPPYKADILSFAEALTRRGVGAVVPHYFASAKLGDDTDGLPLIATHYQTWRTACEDALHFMSDDPRLDPSNLAVLGFSLGGHYALSLAMSPPAGTAIACAVDFFAPTLAPPLAGDWRRIPPLLIHHGLADELVPPQHSEYLKAQLEAAGKRDPADFHLETYPQQGHGFTGEALAKSRSATVSFLLKHL